MRLTTTLLSLTLALLALLAPAIWNGFPITFHDTGGYFARWYEDHPGDGRATPYGLFIEALHLGLQFWPAIVVQGLIVIALIGELGRSTLALAGRRLALFTAGAAVLLALATGISWYSAQLLPDILAPCAVLAAFLLVDGRHERGLWGQAGLALVVALGAATHTGTLALLLGLLLASVLAVLAARLFKGGAAWRQGAGRRLGLIAAGLVIGTLSVPASNYALYGQFRFTPGGDVFLFGRLVQDGIASRYLKDHCPDPTIKLCDHQAELYEEDGTLRSNDSFLWWQGSPLYKIGGWEGAGPELSRITWGSVRDYPLLHLEAAWTSFVQQLGEISSGDGLNDEHWHTRWMFNQYHPEDLDAFAHARQRGGKIPFDEFDQIHLPVGFASMALLPLIAVFFWYRGDGRTARLAAFVLVALIGNAAICGILSNPHDRYQSRLMWLATLTVVVAGVRLAQARTTEYEPSPPFRGERVG
jgi:hypothetical protein